MAVITSAGSGLWSATGTWVGGVVPVNADSVVIASGHVVTLDVDQSGMAAGIAGLTVTGTLNCSTTAGTYYLKTTSDIIGTGTFNAGSSSTPLPDNVTLTVYLNGSVNFHMTGASGTGVQLFCAQPTNKIVKLTAQASAGATVLAVDNDVTGDRWPANSWVRVDHVRKGDADSELRQLASATDNTITLASGLTALKASGSWVVLLRRNILVTGSTGYAFDGGTGWNIGAEVRGNTNGVNSGTGHTISGTLSGNASGTNSGAGHIITGTVSGNTNGVNGGASHVVSGTVSGNTNGVYFGLGHTISGTLSGNTSGLSYGSGHIISGTVSGCTSGVNSGSGHIITGTISNCANGITGGSGYTITGAISNCTTGISRSGFTSYGMTLSGNTTDVTYSGISSGPFLRGRAFNHGGTANDTRAWSAGGAMTHETTIVPAGKSYSHKFTHVDAGYATVMEWEISKLLRSRIAIQVYAKHDATSLTTAQRVRFQIINPGADPLVNVANTPLAEWVAADSTDWQTTVIEYQKTNETPLLLRALATRGSGNSYIYVDEAYASIIVED